MKQERKHVNSNCNDRPTLPMDVVLPGMEVSFVDGHVVVAGVVGS